MTQMAFLWTANVLVWTGIFGYVAFLGRETRQLRRRLWQLEPEGDEQAGYEP